MYIETRYYNNGTVTARMSQSKPVKNEESDKYDSYVEEYELIEGFIDELNLDENDIVPFIIELESECWICITKYV